MSKKKNLSLPRLGVWYCSITGDGKMLSGCSLKILDLAAP